MSSILECEKSKRIATTAIVDSVVATMIAIVLLIHCVFAAISIGGICAALLLVAYIAGALVIVHYKIRTAIYYSYLSGITRRRYDGIMRKI